MRQEEEKIAIACRLSGEGFDRRMEAVRQVYRGARSTEELPDGYAWTFPGSDEWARQLLDFILSERRCCPFLRFELRFEPGDRALRMSLRGSPEVKEFLAGLRSEAG